MEDADSLYAFAASCVDWINSSLLCLIPFIIEEPMLHAVDTAANIILAFWSADIAAHVAFTEAVSPVNAPFKVFTEVALAVFAAVFASVAAINPIFSSLFNASSSVRLCCWSIKTLFCNESFSCESNNLKFFSVRLCVVSPISTNGLVLNISSTGKPLTCWIALPSVFICVIVPATAPPMAEMPWPTFNVAMAIRLCFNKSVLLTRSSTAVPKSAAREIISPFIKVEYVSTNFAWNCCKWASVLPRYALYSLWADPAALRLFCKIFSASVMLFSVALIADARSFPAISSRSALASVSDISLYTFEISRKMS